MAKTLYRGSCPFCSHVGGFNQMSGTRDVLNTLDAATTVLRDPLGNFERFRNQDKLAHGVIAICPECDNKVMKCPHCSEVNPCPSIGTATHCDNCDKVFVNG